MKLLVPILVVSILIVSGCVGQTQEQPDELLTAVTIEMNDGGFSPSTVTLAKGGTITFKNIGTEDHWPASAVHPVHRQYPEGNGCIGSAFDACEGIQPGEEWSFKFDQVGVWGYHDHLNSPSRGVIEIVEN